MRVGIDLDGVCYDFAASVREHLVSAGVRAPEDCPDPWRWEFYEDWGLSLDEFLAHCHKGAEEGIVFEHGGTFPNVREAFERIKAAGHSIHIVTDRSFGRWGVSEAATRTWLDREGLPFDSLTFTADKTAVRLDTMVDDKLANYEALTKAGVRTWLLTRPWNQEDDDRNRVLDLLHYSEVIG